MHFHGSTVFYSISQFTYSLYRCKILRWFLILYMLTCSITSVVSDSWQLQGLQPTRLLYPWYFPGKNTGAGCHFIRGDFPTPGIKPVSPALQADSLLLSHLRSPRLCSVSGQNMVTWRVLRNFKNPKFETFVCQAGSLFAKQEVTCCAEQTLRWRACPLRGFRCAIFEQVSLHF